MEQRKLTATLRKTQPAERASKARIYVDAPADLDGAPLRAQTALARAALAELPELKGVKLRFSRRAGCSCGCSPGFIAEDAPQIAATDFWVDLDWAAIH